VAQAEGLNQQNPLSTIARILGRAPLRQGAGRECQREAGLGGGRCIRKGDFDGSEACDCSSGCRQVEQAGGCDRAGFGIQGMGATRPYLYRHVNEKPMSGNRA
jgi:hypothetical protein